MQQFIFPGFFTTITFSYAINGAHDESLIKIEGGTAGAETLAALQQVDYAQYIQAKKALNDIPMLLPASAAIAGLYALVDNERGVWKAPANINICNAIRPAYLVTTNEQEDLNIDITHGKSINAIRTFTGRGPATVWGARTLAGNDNDWRYIPVRRFFSMIETSVKYAVKSFVFEPNHQNTWTIIRWMIEGYLTQVWKAGALMGSTPRDAFFVHVGLGQTMTALDVLEGRMIIEIGMAVVKPAEFIIIHFTQKMLTDS